MVSAFLLKRCLATLLVWNAIASKISTVRKGSVLVREDVVTFWFQNVVARTTFKLSQISKNNHKTPNKIFAAKPLVKTLKRLLKFS